MGSPRYARRPRGFRAALVEEDRDRIHHPGGLDRAVLQQVLRLAQALRSSERTQRLDSPRSLGRGLGTGRHPRLSRRESVGRLPALDLHDVGRRCGCGESQQRLPGVAKGGRVTTLEREAVQERNRLPSTQKAP